MDVFGSDVDIDGDLLVVGASRERSGAAGIDGDESDNSMGSAGAAYVFARSPAGTWAQDAYVKASNPDIGDRFGTAVAVDGDTIAVGSPWERSNATGIDGDEEDNSLYGAGAVYLFVEDPVHGWVQVAYVKASDTDASDLFGSALDLDGDTLVVGAPEGTLGSGTESEARPTCSHATRLAPGASQARIQASSVEDWDAFGSTVAIDGDTLVVGAPVAGAGTTRRVSSTSSRATQREPGRSSSVSSPRTRLAPTILAGPSTCSATVSVAGAPHRDAGSSMAGAAYVFVRTPSGHWEQRAYLTVADRDAVDTLGWAVAATPNGLIVGARLEDSGATGVGGDATDNSATDAGAVYEFR